MQTRLKNIALSILVTAVALAMPPLTFAQESGAATADASRAGQTKAEKKAARTQARAKKNAELKKLEDAGYNPARTNDIQYPQDIQDAQKKTAPESTPAK